MATASITTPLDPRDEPGLRKCLGLGCGKMFKSLWCGNRKCQKCRAKDASVFVPQEGKSVLRFDVGEE